MATTLPFAPVGTFIDTTRIMLIATFPQNVVKYVQPGDPVEVALKTRPGEVFTGTVDAVIQGTGEGQFRSLEIWRTRPGTATSEVGLAGIQ